MSSIERGGVEVASQQRLSHGMSMCGYEWGATDPSTTEDGSLAVWETGTRFEKPATASDNHTDIMEKTSGGVTSSLAAVFK